MITTRTEDKNKNNFKIITENFKKGSLFEDQEASRETVYATPIKAPGRELDRIDIENLNAFIGELRQSEYHNQVSAGLNNLLKQHVKEFNAQQGDIESKVKKETKFAFSQGVRGEFINGGKLINTRIWPSILRETKQLRNKMQQGDLKSRLQAYNEFKRKVKSIAKRDAKYALADITHSRHRRFFKAVKTAYYLDIDNPSAVHRGTGGKQATDFVKQLRILVALDIIRVMIGVLEEKEKELKRENPQDRISGSQPDFRPDIPQAQSWLENIFASLDDESLGIDADDALRILNNAGNDPQSFKILLTRLAKEMPSVFGEKEIRMLIIMARREQSPGPASQPFDSYDSSMPSVVAGFPARTTSSDMAKAIVRSARGSSDTAEKPSATPDGDAKKIELFNAWYSASEGPPSASALAKMKKAFSPTERKRWDEWPDVTELSLKDFKSNILDSGVAAKASTQAGQAAPAAATTTGTTSKARPQSASASAGTTGTTRRRRGRDDPNYRRSKNARQARLLSQLNASGATLQEETSSNITMQMIQNALMKAGYKLPKHKDDGDYGPETHDAIVAFQRDNNKKKGKPRLVVDGLVGPNTLRALASHPKIGGAQGASVKSTRAAKAAVKTAGLAKASSSTLKSARKSSNSFIRKVNDWMDKTAKRNGYIRNLQSFTSRTKEATGARVTLKNSVRFWGAMLTGDNKALRKLIPKSEHEFFFDTYQLDFDPKKVEKSFPGLMKLYKQNKAIIDKRLKAVGDLDDDQSPTQVTKRMKDQARDDFNEFGKGTLKPAKDLKPRTKIQEKMNTPKSYLARVIRAWVRSGGDFIYDGKPIPRHSDGGAKFNATIYKFNKPMGFKSEGPDGKKVDKSAFKKRYIKLINKFGIPGLNMEFAKTNARLDKIALLMHKKVTKSVKLTEKDTRDARYSEDGT